MYTLSLFVWQITVEGNYSYSDEELLDYVEELGITHGVRKDKIDGESLEKAIRNKYFDITWVSAELSGTRLVLHIKENFDQINSEGSTHSGGMSGESYDVISKENGIIAKMVTRRGTAMVNVGDVIKPGDILIKGQYDIINDAGEIVETKTTNGDGTIYIYARYEYYSELPINYKEKRYYNEYNNYTFALGNLIFDLSFKGEDKEFEDKIYDVTQLKITENYYLPIYLYKNNHKQYELVEQTYTKKECEEIMNERFQYFFENLTEKSIQMVENNVKIEFNGNVCIAKGDIVVLKEIE
jgi:similar to stage IV sporulation protein